MGVNLAVRQAADDEYELVHRLIIEGFREYDEVLVPQSGAMRETVASIREKVAGRGGAVLVIGADGEPIGTALYYYVDDHMYIGRVAVAPEGRGQGAGKAIMHYLEQLALAGGVPEARVSVRCSLPGNVAFYEKLGYAAYSHLFYPEGTDSWYEMKKRLG